MKRWLSIGALMIVVGFVALPSGTLQAQAGSRGRWATVPNLMPINPVHMALLRTGKVLIVSGSGNVATETVYQAAVWDPLTDSVVTQQLSWDMFCNGMVTLPDGRVLINGGNLRYDPFYGEPRNAVFDPATETFSDIENMAHGRWYPTVTSLGDGSVMTFSGLRETGGTNTAVEIYRPGSGWSQEYVAGWTPPLYPRMHLMSNGNVLFAGSSRGSRIFNTTTRTWSATIATTNYGSSRTYGSSVMLPLTPANGYKSRVMIFGGGNPATETTEIIDLSAATPAWQYGPPMSQPRIQMNATILPSGKVLVTGGSRNDEDAATASLNADLYDPVTNTFTSAGANVYPRLYHSNALLLPDATVLLSGGNPQRGNYEKHQEIYSPAYLFNADGSPAVRPVIWSAGSGALRYAGTLQITTPDAANIASVALLRPGTPTHAFDMDQRFIGLSFAAADGVLTVNGPPNGNIAPPGYYMLFILNSAGVPSVATFVNVSSSTNEPPTATIEPAADVTVNPGGSVFFQGSGNDPDGTVASYSWTFPGGTPGTSSSAVAGNVVYNTPGTYVASLTVTDNDGGVSAPATRTVRVADFSVSAAPASQSIAPGASTSYTATVAGGTGFTGAVAFSVTGLPAGAAATFAPSSVTGSGTTTMSVTTSGTTPAGSYVLTIRATSGPVTRTSTVTLAVVGNFTLSASPVTRSITKGGSTTFAVAVAGVQAGASVDLAIEGLPRFASAKFRPDPLVGSGNSTLSISGNKKIAAGTYPLTIRGTTGGTVRTTAVTLVVQ